MRFAAWETGSKRNRYLATEVMRNRNTPGSYNEEKKKKKKITLLILDAGAAFPQGKESSYALCFCLQKKGEKLNNSGWSNEGLTNLLKYYFVLLACSFIHVVEKLINSTQPNVTSS